MKFKCWLTKDAAWYKFWLPQSSVVGGAICGTVLAIIAIVIVECYLSYRG